MIVQITAAVNCSSCNTIWLPICLICQLVHIYLGELRRTLLHHLLLTGLYVLVNMTHACSCSIPPRRQHLAEARALLAV